MILTPWYLEVTRGGEVMSDLHGFFVLFALEYMNNNILMTCLRVCNLTVLQIAALLTTKVMFSCCVCYLGGVGCHVQSNTMENETDVNDQIVNMNIQFCKNTIYIVNVYIDGSYEMVISQVKP